MSASRVVLDGELIVWNKTRGVFEPFGGLRSTVNAANEGAPADKVCVFVWGAREGTWFRGRDLCSNAMRVHQLMRCEQTDRVLL